MKWAKITADMAMVVVSGIMMAFLWQWVSEHEWILGFLTILLLIAVAALVDAFIQYLKKDDSQDPKLTSQTGIQRLILLDEQDKPVRQWEMAGRTAIVIGRRNQEEEVDVDLEECEYSTFIDPCHAVLNFCLDSWYIEDLGSQNGVKIRKVEDGICYKVLNRPCKINVGDVICIANTRLLLT